jgi:RHS repeat-associated protein
VYFPAWHGTLIQNKRDASGLEYKRNRVYDPVTGRFTQEDPVWFVGGVNAYGFAGADPVNYSDPFGLCPYGKGKRDTNTKDCPNDKVGEAVRALDDYGGVEGDLAIHTMATYGLSPTLVSADEIGRRCGANAVACTSGQTIYLADTRVMGTLAADLAHETAHVEMGDIYTPTNLCRNEPRAWRRGLLVWSRLPARLQGSFYGPYYRWFQRDSSAVDSALVRSIRQRLQGVGVACQ